MSEETIGQRIKKLRKEKKWTQLELANRLHVKKNTISQYETDTNKPDRDIESKLADVFGVSIDYLRKGLISEQNSIESEPIYVYADPEGWIEKLATEYKEKTGQELPEWKKKAILELIEANRQEEDKK